jgi:N-acetylmuramoyl-L-alanine amidase
VVDRNCADGAKVSVSSHDFPASIRQEYRPWIEDLPIRPTAKIDTVVLHSTEEPSLEDARRIADESAEHISAHYYIDRDGSVHQWVPDDRIAWHAAGWNTRSLGIELVNLGRFPEHYSFVGQIPDEPFPQAQQRALIGLLRHLRRRFPSLVHLLRHSDVDRTHVPASDAPEQMVRRRIDPGPQLPWTSIQTSWSAARPDAGGEVG